MVTAVLGLAGSLISGIASAQANQYQAAIARSNAQQAKVNARLAFEKAEIDAQDAAKENAGKMGLEIARQGSSGIALSSPSLVRTRARSIELSQVEAERIYRQGYAVSANYKTESNQFNAQADAYSSAASWDIVGAAVKGIGNLIAGAQPTAMSPSYVPVSVSRPKFFASVA